MPERATRPRVRKAATAIPASNVLRAMSAAITVAAASIVTVVNAVSDPRRNAASAHPRIAAIVVIVASAPNAAISSSIVPA